MIVQSSTYVNLADTTNKMSHVWNRKPAALSRVSLAACMIADCFAADWFKG